MGIALTLVKGSLGSATSFLIMSVVLNALVSPLKSLGEMSLEEIGHPVFIDTALVEVLEKIRVHFGKPVTITSGFRTASWNAKQKNAAKFSQHLYGKAADIQVQGISVEQVYAYADKLLGNAGGCGIYPPGLGRANGWVHVDVRKAKSRWKG